MKTRNCTKLLAGVSIATLTGDNGILTQANNAKEKTEEAEVEELRKLTQGEAATHLEEYEYTDANGEKVNIPAECAVSQVEGENTVENGLVIIDSNGNEWVWIKVPKNEMPEGLSFENEEDYTTLETALQTYTADYRESGYTDTWYNGCGLGEDEYVNLKQDMLKSVYRNGGFYIGRYEVGSFDNPVNSNDNTRTAVIQANAFSYGYVTCGQSQQLAVKLAIRGKTTSLMFGIQWDLVCKYIEENAVKLGTTLEERQEKIKSDSAEWGNYKNSTFSISNSNLKYSDDYGITYKTVNAKIYTKNQDSSILLTTGATERNSMLNIYDFAGNVFEWTLEKSSDNNNPCVIRGGYYNGDSFSYPSSKYINRNISDNGDYMGFRIALY